MLIFDTHFGTSTIVDDETGIILSWQNGKFDETHEYKVDPSTLAINEQAIKKSKLALLKFAKDEFHELF